MLGDSSTPKSGNEVIKGWSTTRRWVIQSFIVVHVGIILWSGFPQTSRVTHALYKPFETYQNFVGIWQGWMMFAPNPSRQDYTMDGQVVLKDGSPLVYDFSRPYQVYSFEKYKLERIRKMVSNLREDRNRLLWDDTSRYVLRQLRPHTGWSVENPPVEVRLIRYWNEIPLLADKFISHGQLHSNYKSYHFHTLKVQEGDL